MTWCNRPSMVRRHAADLRRLAADTGGAAGASGPAAARFAGGPEEDAAYATGGGELAGRERQLRLNLSPFVPREPRRGPLAENSRSCASVLAIRGLAPLL